MYWRYYLIAKRNTNETIDELVILQSLLQAPIPVPIDPAIVEPIILLTLLIRPPLPL